MGNKTVKRAGILLGIVVLLGGTGFALWWYQVEQMAQGVVADAVTAEQSGDYIREQGGFSKAADRSDLRLMSPVRRVRDIPTGGKSLIVVAAVDHVLHFRMFDHDGNMITNTNEKKLTGKAEQIEGLRTQLANLWPPHVLTGSEKGEIITAFTSIAGRTPDEFYQEAAEKYQEHLAVKPSDVEAQLKYGDLLIKHDWRGRQPELALEIYSGLVKQFPGREDVRLRVAEVATELATRGGGALLERARDHLKILLKTAKNDGHLEFLMGRCHEEDKEYGEAEHDYESAIKHDAPERIEAARRLATLLDKRGETEKANQVVDAMVESAPDDYRVYLERGRYRSRSGPSSRGDAVRKALKTAPGLGLGWLAFYLGGGDDFRKALALAPKRPEVYQEVARAAERESGYDAARQVLDNGLAEAPGAVELYSDLASLEFKAGHIDRAIDALLQGLKSIPDQSALHVQLAQIMAEHGGIARSRELLLQIRELERLGAGRQFTQYLMAYYHFNRREFVQAKQKLTRLQSDVAEIPPLKAAVNVLLSKCYAMLDEPEMAREAMLRAYSTSPDLSVARLGWIQGLIERGQIDEAIREYQGLLTTEPKVRIPLAWLLIERNRRLPAPQREWGNVERLLADAAAADPGNDTPEVLRVKMLVERDQKDRAIDVLETARKRFPRSVGLWIMQVEILEQRKEFSAARALLDEARRKVGDQVEIRQERARLAIAGNEPGIVSTLNDLAAGIEVFSREDRRKLLTELATDLAALKDLAGAARVWSRLAEQEPESLQPRLQLFELALRSGDAKQAEAQIRAVERLDGQLAQLWRALYLSSQARTAADRATKTKMEDEARGLLTELKTRRPDWYRVPLAMARLDEQELEETGLDDARKRELLESSIASYRRAIELGFRDPALVRHVVQLLFRAGRGGEALEVYNQVPGASQLAGDLEQIASKYAFANRDFRQAADLARKAAEANPDDFQARLWLAHVLAEDRRTDEAEAVLRAAVDAAKADPDRWINLVRFEVLNRHPEKAEQITREAEGQISKMPLALAQCCTIVGKAYEAGEPDRARPWYDRARGWYTKAQEALKDPDDQTVRRRLAAFFVLTNQAAEAEGPLKEILSRTAAGKSPDVAAWARRALAEVYAIARPPRTAEALALFADPALKGDVTDPDDLRVLSIVHEAQGTPEGRRQAIGDLESLVGRESATPDDRRRLAQLLDLVGEWSRAREQFRELILRTEGVRDPETLRLRPLYFELFVTALTRHHQPGDDSGLAEARQLIEKLKQMLGDSMLVVLLDARIDKAAGQLDAATARIRDVAGRPGLTTADRLRLAEAAERIGLLDAAEVVYRRVAAEPPADPNQFMLVGFLARHGRVKDAVDLCETLWADADLREKVAGVCVSILCDPASPFDEAQVRRVLGWIERARSEKPTSMVYLFGLGNLNERLRDYRRAEEMYRAAIHLNDPEGIASNNLAWLIALQGGRASEALTLINSAIRANGATNPNPFMPVNHEAAKKEAAVSEFLDTRGMIYLKAGETERALDDLKKALKGAPSPPKYFHLAQAYLQLNDNEKARQALKDGKTRGLPAGLHPLELAAYKEVSSKLGMP